jgi:cbb3-type cytochrome oxidase subunit 3
MILFFVFFLCVLLYLFSQPRESFQNKTSSSILSFFDNKIMEGINNRIISNIPYKHHYYKIKRYWRHR